MWIIISIKWTFSLSVSVSGEISKDVAFFHELFPVQPSMRAIIGIYVSYPESSVRKHGHNPRIGIYTTQDHINIFKKCTYARNGQLANANLYPPIRLDESDLYSPKCLKEGLDNIHCKGNISIKDFQPRNFAFSFGFYCDQITANSSLKGLVYNISIYEQTNVTSCIYLPRKVRHLCSRYFVHGLIPYLIGLEDMVDVLSHWGMITSYATIFMELCYQHLQELMCHIVVPKCDPVSGQVIHPCREMCYDFKNACSKITLSMSIYLSEKMPHIKTNNNKMVLDITAIGADCEYLPSSRDNISCLYKPII